VNASPQPRLSFLFNLICPPDSTNPGSVTRSLSDLPNHTTHDPHASFIFIPILSASPLVFPPTHHHIYHLSLLSPSLFITSIGSSSYFLINWQVQAVPQPASTSSSPVPVKCTKPSRIHQHQRKTFYLPCQTTFRRPSLSLTDTTQQTTSAGPRLTILTANQP
jgi:hypothetical protein